MSVLAVVPSTPLLVEPFDRAGTAELRAIRTAARRVVGDLIGSEAERVVVLGDGTTTKSLDERAGGDLGPWGVSVRVGGPDRTLGLAHTVGAWLLDDADWHGPRAYVADLDTVTDRDAVLVVADGTTKRTERAPGHLDARAQPFDLQVAEALAAGDAKALAQLDLQLGHQLGAAAIDVLAAIGEWAASRDVDDAELLVHEAPLGVGYWVARWRLT